MVNTNNKNMAFKAQFSIEYMSADSTTLLTHEDTVTVNHNGDEVEATAESFRDTIILFGEDAFKNGFNYEDGDYVYLVPASRVIGFNFKLIDG